MVRQAIWKLTPVYGTWKLDADDRGPSNWREIEQIVDKVINPVITRSELGEIREAMFHVNL